MQQDMHFVTQHGSSGQTVGTALQQQHKAIYRNSSTVIASSARHNKQLTTAISDKF